MTEVPVNDLPVGFTLAVPQSWFELALSPARRDEAIHAVVEQRLRDQPELWEHRGAVRKLLREQARRAWDAGSVYCACLVRPTPDGPITASVTVSLVSGPLGVPSDAEDRVNPLLERLQVKEAAHEGDTWCRPEVVNLAEIGPCARTSAVEDLALPDGAGVLRAVVMQTFVPVPDDRRVLVVSASSPVLDLAEELLDLFDAITSTLRLVSM